MKSNSYDVTLNLSASERKLLNQIWRERKDTLPTIESAVYKLALDGIRTQLGAKKEANKEKFNARKSGKRSKSRTKTKTKSQIMS